MVDPRQKPICPYGERCYRKNPQHLREMDHFIKCRKGPATAKKGNPGLITSYFTQKPAEESNVDKTNLAETNRKNKKSVKRSLDSISPTASKRRSSDGKPNETCEATTSKSVLVSKSFRPPSTPEEANQLIEKLFLVSMPDSFFTFWDFCKEINSSNPTEALAVMDLKLVGPFDVLTGRLNESHIPVPYEKKIEKNEEDDDGSGDEEDEYADPEDRNAILRHWRFFYDPPEVQTFAVHIGSTGYHLGFHRDEPTNKEPMVIVSDPQATPGTLTGLADNIFAALFQEGKRVVARYSRDVDRKNQVKELMKQISDFARQHKIDVQATTKLEDRRKLVVAKTLNTFGINVPMSGDVGYRPLPKDDKELAKMFERISKLPREDRRGSFDMKKLREIFTLIEFANDECDFGMGLELGMDLFVGGQAFHKSCERLLTLAYKFLNRHAFIKILKSHLKNRSEGKELQFD